MVRLVLTTLLFWSAFISALFSESSEGITVPLTPHPPYGVYTASIKVISDVIQRVDVIVDTGSAPLVFVGNNKRCPSCRKALTKGAINTKKMKLESKATLVRNYGSTHDQFNVFTALIQVNNQPPVKMDFLVLLKSSQPSSILGMLPDILGPGMQTATSFIRTITNQFSLFHQLTFVLCSTRGDSYFHLGPLDLPKPIFVGHLASSHVYVITTSGFYDDTSQPIEPLAKLSGKAVIDTGTGGFIVLQSTLHKAIVNYIYQHTSTKNKQLGAKFWKNNDCVLNSEVDFMSLPTLKIGFKDAYSSDPAYLMLPGTTYLSKAGCGIGYVRLVFVKGLPIGHPQATSKNYVRKKIYPPPDMIIGTSLLNHYAFQIDYKEHSLSFYDSRTLCEKNP